MLLLLPVVGTKSGLDKFHLKEWFSLKMAELDLFYIMDFNQPMLLGDVMLD